MSFRYSTNSNSLPELLEVNLYISFYLKYKSTTLLSWVIVNKYLLSPRITGFMIIISFFYCTCCFTRSIISIDVINFFFICKYCYNIRIFLYKGSFFSILFCICFFIKSITVIFTINFFTYQYFWNIRNFISRCIFVFYYMYLFMRSIIITITINFFFTY